jgi:GxxExxY protein
MAFKYKSITEKIIGAAFAVHSQLGPGFQEVIYQRALSFEFNRENLAFSREVEQDIYYKDITDPIGARRVDFIVEDKVLIEIKAASEIEPVHKAQLLNYLKVYEIEVGLLINFGSKSLEFKRFVM